MKLIEYINNKINETRWKLREHKEYNNKIEKYRHLIYVSYGWKPTKREARKHIEFTGKLHSQFERCKGHYIMPIIQR